MVSPIPSYQLVYADLESSPLHNTLSRLPLSYQEGVLQESDLYDALRQEAVGSGWVFVETLELLRLAADSVALYNDFDYHIEPAASELIGSAQAEAIYTYFVDTMGSP